MDTMRRRWTGAARVACALAGAVALAGCAGHQVTRVDDDGGSAVRLVLPEGASEGAPAPVAFMVHGWNGRQYWMGPPRQGSWRLKVERALRGKGYAAAWLKYAKHRDRTEQSVEVHRTEFELNLAEVRGQVRAVEAQAAVDPKQSVYIGQSQGGLLALALAAHDETTALAVNLAGMYLTQTPKWVGRWESQAKKYEQGRPNPGADDDTWVAENAALVRAQGRRRAPALMVYGAKDPKGDAEVSKRLFEALRQGPEDALVMDGGGHHVMSRPRRWLAQALERLETP